LNKTKNFKYLYYLIGLIIVAIITYSPTFQNEFTNWDDHKQVTDNIHIKEISFQNIKSIFSSFYVGMYQPFTTTIFSIEHAFFGMSPLGFHSISLLFHLLNICLVFWFVRLFTNRKDVALVVAALFAVHPMFVEAVAWVSSSSTLIYASFYLGAIISYLYYLKTNLKKFLLITFFLFLCSLLSKVMAVTLPILLLLFDYYYNRKLSSKKVLFEKIPFLMLSLLFGIIAIYGRHVEGHISEEFGLLDKPFLISYQLVWYVSKFVFPVNLSAYYPGPEKIEGFLPYFYYFGGLLILLSCYFACKLKTYQKSICFCILFFLINIFLVLNFIQVGNQQTTDRYTYIAYIGFFLLIGYGYKYILEKKPQLKSFLIVVILTIVVLFSYQSYQRTKIWNNSRSLWSDVILKNNKLALAYSNLGVTYVGENNEIAEEYFLKAIVLDPGFVIPYNNIGFLNIEKDPKKAEQYLFKAMGIDPSYLYIYTNLANLYMKTDKLKARKYILKAVALNSENKYVLERVNSWNKQWIR